MYLSINCLKPKATHLGIKIMIKFTFPDIYNYSNLSDLMK